MELDADEVAPRAENRGHATHSKARVCGMPMDAGADAKMGMGGSRTEQHVAQNKNGPEMPNEEFGHAARCWPKMCAKLALSADMRAGDDAKPEDRGSAEVARARRGERAHRGCAGYVTMVGM